MGGSDFRSGCGWLGGQNQEPSELRQIIRIVSLACSGRFSQAAPISASLGQSGPKFCESICASSGSSVVESGSESGIESVSTGVRVPGGDGREHSHFSDGGNL